MIGSMPITLTPAFRYLRKRARFWVGWELFRKKIGSMWGTAIEDFEGRVWMLACGNVCDCGALLPQCLWPSPVIWSVVSVHYARCPASHRRVCVRATCRASATSPLLINCWPAGLLASFSRNGWHSSNGTLPPPRRRSLLPSQHKCKFQIVVLVVSISQWHARDSKLRELAPSWLYPTRSLLRTRDWLLPVI